MLCFFNCFTMHAQNRARGLCIMWTNLIEVTILYNTNHLIHCHLTHKETRKDWLLTCIYGPPYWKNRSSFWDELSTIADSVKESWVILDYMNETTSLQDKLGGSSVTNSSRNFLSKFIEHTGIIELVYCGNPYPWCNNRFRGQFIKKRRPSGSEKGVLIPISKCTS